MPFDFGIGEIAIVLVIGLLVFGPKKLPEISRGIGSGMRDFRRGLAGEADPCQHLGGRLAVGASVLDCRFDGVDRPFHVHDQLIPACKPGHGRLLGRCGVRQAQCGRGVLWV